MIQLVILIVYQSLSSNMVAVQEALVYKVSGDTTVQGRNSVPTSQANKLSIKIQVQEWSCQCPSSSILNSSSRHLQHHCQSIRSQIVYNMFLTKAAHCRQKRHQCTRLKNQATATRVLAPHRTNCEFRKGRHGPPKRDMLELKTSSV